MMEQSDLDLLQTVPVYHLQSLIKARRLPLSLKDLVSNVTSAPMPTITEIAQYLYLPPSIEEAIHDLNSPDLAVLRELVSCGGRANSRDLALYFTKKGLFAPVKNSDPFSTGEPTSNLYPIPHPHGAFEQSLHRLLILGLLFWGKQTNFAGRDYTNGVYDGVLIVPHAVRHIVHDLPLQQTTTKSEPQAQASFSVEDIDERLRLCQRHLYLYWSHVASQREGLPLVSSRLLSRNALRQVVDLFGKQTHLEQIRTEQDAPRELFMRLLLMQLGLLRERNNSIVALPSDDFFGLPLQERIHRCLHSWLETSFWNELASLPDVVVRPGPLPLEPAAAETIKARRQVLDRLLCEEPASWLDLAAFIARTKLYVPYLLFPRQYGSRADRYSTGSNPYGWDFRLRRGWLTHREGWHMVEGGFIRAILSGPLYWLGLIDLKNDEGNTAFRLVANARQLAGKMPPSGSNIAWGKLIIQPNFEVVALAPVSESLLVKLDRFAERVRLEHIAQYRLTKASITRAIQSGMHAQDILRLLQEFAGESGEIPQNVQYSLAEWERQARRVEMWQHAALIEFDDAAQLDALFADEEARSMFRRRLTPVLAELDPARIDAVQQLLWQRHVLPALTPAPQQDTLSAAEQTALASSSRPPTPDRGPQWKLHADGLLEPLHPVTDLYLASDVERFSAVDEATGYYKITPEAIQLACTGTGDGNGNGNSLTLASIINFLQIYCAGGVPPSFIMRLKLWGGGYGDQAAITIERSPMLYLSPHILQDLHDDPQIQALLGLEVPQQGRLVRVPPERLDNVIKILRERGFTITADENGA
jgi:hypothetical protein